MALAPAREWAVDLELSAYERDTQPNPPILATRIWNKASAALLALCSIAYFLAAGWTSAHNRLWMDEVLATWTARFHSPRMIWDAVLHGSISSPPTYFLLLSSLTKIFGESKLVLRSPSIVAVYVIGLAAFVLIRRRFTLPIASLALVLCLETGLLEFAMQVREYALYTACFALAVVLWDIEPSQTFSKARAFGIAALLAFGVCLHFYAVLLVPALGVMELIWSIINRRIRPVVWVGLFVAGATVFAWLPLMRKLAAYNATAARSTLYFAKPTASRLLSAYGDLAFGDKGATLFVVFCCVVSFLLLVNHKFPLLGKAQSSSVRLFDLKDSNLDIIIFGAITFPLIVFLFAATVTHTFNERYAIAGCLGFVLLFARLISSIRLSAVVCALLLAASLVLFGMLPSHVVSLDKDGLDVLEQMHGNNAPVVVGEGLTFFELSEAANPQLKNRLFYLTMPEGYVSSDSTNQNLVTGWHQLRPDLNVSDLSSFVASHDHFYLLHTDKSTDDVTPWLITHRSVRMIWHNSNAFLCEVGNGNAVAGNAGGKEALLAALK